MLVVLDHIDGDHDNNSPANLQALCANCHAYKTATNGDYLQHAYRRNRATPQYEPQTGLFKKVRGGVPGGG